MEFGTPPIYVSLHKVTAVIITVDVGTLSGGATGAVHSLHSGRTWSGWMDGRSNE